MGELGNLEKIITLKVPYTSWSADCREMSESAEMVHACMHMMRKSPAFFWISGNEDARRL